MTKKDFMNENFGFPVVGDTAFRSAAIYGSKFKNVDIGLAHLRRCFINCDYAVYDDEYNRVPISFKSSKNVLVKLWRRAKNLKEFKQLIKENKEASLTQFAGELLKGDRGFLKQFINKEQSFITSSDMGGVKIGTDGFSIVVPNGYGDTSKNIVSINEKGSINSSAFTFWTSISGKEINIYDYDCGDNIVVTLSGKYGIYYNNRIIIFEKWED